MRGELADAMETHAGIIRKPVVACKPENVGTNSDINAKSQWHEGQRREQGGGDVSPTSGSKRPCALAALR